MNNNISIDLIKKLRKKTSISLIKCKQALIESRGNFELAIDILRKSGLKIDFNTSDRTTSSGIIVTEITSDQKIGLILEINCETDFVSKNKIFKEFSKTILHTALHESLDNIHILRERFQKQRLILMNQINENILINRFMMLKGDFLNSYVHRSRIGVIVASSGCINTDIMKYIAMHIAAKNPKYININNIPNSIINRERLIQLDIAKKSVKSEIILEKVIKGRIEKFINEIVLMQQKFVLDENQTVKKILDEYCIKIDNFVRFQIGDYD